MNSGRYLPRQQAIPVTSKNWLTNSIQVARASLYERSIERNTDRSKDRSNIDNILISSYEKDAPTVDSETPIQSQNEKVFMTSRMYEMPTQEPYKTNPIFQAPQNTQPRNVNHKLRISAEKNRSRVDPDSLRMRT